MKDFAIDRCPNCGMGLRQRSHEQNAGMHVLFDEIAKRKDWPSGSGQLLDAETWKRLLLAAYERTQGRAAQAFPALDGQGWDFVHRRSSRLSKREASEFMEFVMAWSAENGISVALEVA